MMKSSQGPPRVAARETFVTLTTNRIGPEARAPVLVPDGHMHIYPYDRRDHLIDERDARRWRALVIENEYLRATALPELGGRLFSLYDKVSRREIFTSPRRFRFGRIHLRGAWAPVGIEFNFPLGHTVTSTVPVTCLLERHGDGSASIVSGSVDLVTGMHWAVRMTLRPGVGRLLFHNRFANPTDLPHGGMYWHNASVLVSEGFRFQSRANLAYVLEGIGPFPWREGRDYTWYRNRLWSSDLFLVDVPEDWFGYYNHDVEYGALHVADRRGMPGKKFFSWGAAPDGLIWSRTFGLGGRHYGELQAGFLDTQSQKRRFDPGRVLECEECWFPIGGLGDVLQAGERVAVGLRAPAGEGPPRLTVLVTEAVGPVTVACWDRGSGRRLLERTLNPTPLRTVGFPLLAAPGPSGVRVRVAAAGRVLLDREVPPLKAPTAVAVRRARNRIHPRHPKTARGLLAAAVEAVQFQRFAHAESLLGRVLEKNPRLAAAHRELGWLALRRYAVREALRCFRRARRLDPGDPWSALGLGQALEADERPSAARPHLEHAARQGATRVTGTLALVRLLAGARQWDEALERLADLARRHPEAAEARLLSAAVAAALGRPGEARGHLRAGVERWPTHPLALALPYLMAEPPLDPGRLWQRLREACGADTQVILDAAVALAAVSLSGAAVRLLEALREDEAFPRCAMMGYLGAYWLMRGGEEGRSKEWLRWAAACPAERTNPSRPAEMLALEWAVSRRPEDAHAHLFLGNWYAARGRDTDALRAWRRAVTLDPRCAVAHRNIGFTLFRRRRQLPKATAHYRAALAQRPDEVYFYLEAERVLALAGRMTERVALLESAPGGLKAADAWIMAYAAALEDAGRPAEALAALSGEKGIRPEKGVGVLLPVGPRGASHKRTPTPFSGFAFAPARDLIHWEGERGPRECWVECHLSLGRAALAAGDLGRAERHFRETLRYPPNLLYGEPFHTERSTGLYHLGLVAEARGDRASARAHHTTAAGEKHLEKYRFYAPEVYYYSALSAQWLGRRALARRILSPAARAWRHLKDRPPPTLNERFGHEDYRHPMGVGLALKALGRYEEARRALRLVLRLYGPQAETVWHLRTLRTCGLEAIGRSKEGRTKR